MGNGFFFCTQLLTGVMNVPVAFLKSVEVVPCKRRFDPRSHKTILCR